MSHAAPRLIYYIRADFMPGPPATNASGCANLLLKERKREDTRAGSGGGDSNGNKSEREEGNHRTFVTKGARTVSLLSSRLEIKNIGAPLLLEAVAH